MESIQPSYLDVLENQYFAVKNNKSQGTLQLDLVLLFLFHSTETSKSERMLIKLIMSQLLKFLKTHSACRELDSTFATTHFLQTDSVVRRVLQVSKMDQVEINQIPFKHKSF